MCSPKLTLIALHKIFSHHACNMILIYIYLLIFAFQKIIQKYISLNGAVNIISYVPHHS